MDWPTKVQIIFEDSEGIKFMYSRCKNSTSYDAKFAADLFLAHAKEAQDQYRSFGTLRALVIWFPLTIISAPYLFIFGRDEVCDLINNYGYWITLPLLIVFFLVFLAQYRMQITQLSCINVAKKAQENAINVNRGEQIHPCSFSAIRKRSGREDTLKLSPDLSSWSLFFFLFILYGMHFYYIKHQIECPGAKIFASGLV